MRSLAGGGRSSVRLPWPGASAEAAPLRLDATAMPSAATTSNAAAAPAKVVRFATEKFTKLPQAVEQQLLITLEWLMRNWLLARNQASTYMYMAPCPTNCCGADSGMLTRIRYPVRRKSPPRPVQESAASRG